MDYTQLELIDRVEVQPSAGKSIATAGRSIGFEHFFIIETHPIYLYYYPKVKNGQGVQSGIAPWRAQTDDAGVGRLS